MRGQIQMAASSSLCKQNIYEPYIQIMEQYDFPEDIMRTITGGVPELWSHTVFGHIEGMI